MTIDLADDLVQHAASLYLRLRDFLYRAAKAGVWDGLRTNELPAI